MITLQSNISNQFIQKTAYLYLGLFLILFCVWIVPETITYRYNCLVIGCLITLLICLKDQNFTREIFKSKSLICIALFFGWVIVHYYFLSENKSIALQEIEKLHKRAILGAVFAIGFAYVLVRSSLNATKIIFLFSLSLVPIIYLVSAIFIPEAFQWSYKDNLSQAYIPKYMFVFFSVFSFSWMAYEIQTNLKQKFSPLKLLLPLLILMITFYDYFDLHAKNGLLYLAIISLILFALIFFGKLVISKRMFLIVFLIFSLFSVFSFKHIQQQPTWLYLHQDIGVALQTEQFINWKYKNGQRGILENASHRPVSITTYERIAWFKEGSKLIPKYPLGYGLIQDSFKYLGIKEWPDSDLTHTHSGWIDLALGFGIPGVLLVFIAIVFAFLQCLKSDDYYARSGIFILPLFTFVFLTSEMCEKLSYEFFIFIIVFYAALGIPNKAKIIEH